MGYFRTSKQYPLQGDCFRNCIHTVQGIFYASGYKRMHGIFILSFVFYVALGHPKRNMNKEPTVELLVYFQLSTWNNIEQYLVMLISAEPYSNPYNVQ